MASLPPIRKLYMEDYQSQKNWIGPFLTILNSFMTSVVSALTKNLTIIDNTTSDIKYVTLSSVPTSTAPVNVSWSKPFVPVGILVCNVQSISNGSILSTAVQVQWQMTSNNGAIQLINLVGLTPTQTSQYFLTLLCIAG